MNRATELWLMSNALYGKKVNLMDGLHYTVTTTRAKMAETLKVELPKLVESKLTENTNAVIMTFMDEDEDSVSMSHGYMGEEEAYLMMAGETLVSALAHITDNENNEEMIEYIREHVREMSTFLALLASKK